MKFSLRLMTLLLCLAMIWLNGPQGRCEKPKSRIVDSPAWRFTVKPEVYDNYLAFPTSKIGTITRLSVYYQSMELNKPVGEPVHYKDFYFDRDQAIGSKQVGDVRVEANTIGTIAIKTAPKQTSTSAAAFVAIRLFLELYAQKTFPNFVVDQSIFTDFVQAVNHLGFSPLPQPPPQGLKPKAVVLVTSEPRGASQLLMY